ncbi:MAG TPA: hypothetical protein VKN76_07070 [Kiloniellaceae bacterium]|nr:hypothetical protein [Kiloniellaceae bacterium]
MRLNAVLTMAVLSLVFLTARPAFACVDGLEMVPGDSCEIDVKWGYDHWVVGVFEQGEHTMSFEHVKGDCNVSLFGPTNGLLSPDNPPIRTVQPGEYHLFTRAISLAQQACRYRISVE